MATQHQTSGNGQASNTNSKNNNPDLTAIVDDVIARVREILNDLEQIVQDAFDLFDMIRELYYKIIDLFTMRAEKFKSEMELA